MRTLGLLIEPLDVLFFRDARPFSAGDQGRSQLPMPQTFAGMVKTHLMRIAGLSSGDTHGNHPRSLPPERRHWWGNVCCRGPWLCTLEKGTGDEPSTLDGPLLAAPADLVRLGKSADAPLGRLRPLAEAPPGWQPPEREPRLLPLWHSGAEAVKPAGGFLDVDGLRTYLAGEVPNTEHLHPADALFGREPRTGIGVDAATGTAEDARIYSVSLLRLRPGVAFYAEVDLPDTAPDAASVFPNGGVLLPWGGEGRRVRVHAVDPFDWAALCPAATGDEDNDRRLLTLMATPGLFANRAQGWKPEPRGTLIAASVPKPTPVSGWDLAGRAAENGDANEITGAGGHPRATRWAIPAGAVYLWRRGTHSTSPAPEPGLLGLSEKPMHAAAGWGLALPGRWSSCPLPTPTAR